MVKSEKYSRKYAFSCMLECGFAAALYQDGIGTVVRSTARLSGSVTATKGERRNSVQIVREYQKQQSKKRSLKVTAYYAIITKTY